MLGVTHQKIYISLVAVVILLAGSFPGASQAKKKKQQPPLEHVVCGQLIDHDIRLANSLVDCPGDGLVVDSPNVLIDLNDHRIDGTSAEGSIGVVTAGPIGRIKVMNGVISDFESGITLSGGERYKLKNLVVTDNSLGARLDGVGAAILRSWFGNNGTALEVNSDHARIESNMIIDNADGGIDLPGVKPFVSRNTIANNGDVGISIGGAGAEIVHNTVLHHDLDALKLDSGSLGATVEGNEFAYVPRAIRLNESSDNEITDNFCYEVDTGISLTDSDGNTLSGNRVVGASESGIALAGTDNRLVSNDVSGGEATGIFVAGDENVLKRNRTHGNADNGIDVAGSFNILISNKAEMNGVNGIVSATSAIVLENNKANRNGLLGGPPGDDAGLGISVPSGSQSSGNKAVGNDDPAECEAADVDCHVP